MKHDEIRYPEHFLRRREQRAMRRARANRQQRGSYYFGDMKAQLDRLQQQCNAINATAIARGELLGQIDAPRVMRACVHRVEKFYGMRNKCVTRPGYRK